MSLPGSPDVAEEAVDRPTDRPTDLRMSRLHLRMGALELARAELEALAGGSELDTDALIDLAEARWRTGDLPGAGVAANAYLAADRDDPLAVVIAAEASAAAGHPGEARELVARVLGRDGLDLDAIFAGMPQSWIWPLEPTAEAVATGELFPDAMRPMADGLSIAAAGVVLSPGPIVTQGSRPSDTAVSASTRQALGPAPATTPDPELAAARSALDAGDAAAAGDRLAALLRSRPELASAILDTLERAMPGPPGSSETAFVPDGGPDRSRPGDPPPADPPPSDPPLQ